MKFLEKKVIPIAWGILWIIAITALSIGASAWSIKWMLSMLGVIV